LVEKGNACRADTSAVFELRHEPASGDVSKAQGHEGILSAEFGENFMLLYNTAG
jgi:hypothetical protein